MYNTSSLPLPFDPSKHSGGIENRNLNRTTVSTMNTLKMINGLYFITTTTTMTTPVQRTTVTTTISVPSPDRYIRSTPCTWKPKPQLAQAEENIKEGLNTPRKSTFKFTNHTTFKFVNYTNPQTQPDSQKKPKRK